MYKSGFVENIRRINGNVHQRKDCVFRESSELFFLEWWQWIHTQPWTAFLSPSSWPKGGRWKSAGQGSGCSPLPWNHSSMVEKRYSGSLVSWLFFFFKRCTEVIKREHWITQRFTDLATWRISFAETQDTHFPYTGTGGYWQQHGQATIPETSTLSVERPRAKDSWVFCKYYFSLCHHREGKCVSV